MATRVSGQRSDEGGGAQAPLAQVAGWLLPLVAVGLLVALKPEIVRGTFSSLESIARVGALIAGWILFSWLAHRFIPNTAVRTALITVAAGLLLWSTVAPYFAEDLEVAGRAPEQTTSPAEGGTDPASPPMAAPGVPPEPAAPEPVRLTAGRFRGLDGHRGSGEASVVRQPDGTHVVAFRNLSVSSVPDPVVYLVPGADRQSTDGGTRLGRLDPRRDRYEIPAGVDVGERSTVLIWCQRFAVPVAGATQAPA